MQEGVGLVFVNEMRVRLEGGASMCEMRSGARGRGLVYVQEGVGLVFVNEMRGGARGRG